MQQQSSVDCREGKLIGFDRDPDAIAACRGAFGEELARGERSRVELVHGSYVLACSREDLRGRVQGILLDLGVSSHQLDEPSRGFSYRFDAPLDLRFGGDAASEPSAAELLASLDEREIADILYRYGEERSSRRIARAIVTARAARADPNDGPAPYDCRAVCSSAAAHRCAQPGLPGAPHRCQSRVGGARNISQLRSHSALPGWTNCGDHVPFA